MAREENGEVNGRDRVAMREKETRAPPDSACRWMLESSPTDSNVRPSGLIDATRINLALFDFT